MSLVQFAEEELKRLGSDDEMQSAMNKHVLHMVKEFADEGHSGFSASYALSIIKRLLAYKPITPLTGNDDEWGHVSDVSGSPLWQNKRCFSVFKDGDGQAYNIDGKVFWEWYTDKETGEKHKSYYTSSESRTPVTFPYTVPDEPIYEYKESN